MKAKISFSERSYVLKETQETPDPLSKPTIIREIKYATSTFGPLVFPVSAMCGIFCFVHDDDKEGQGLKVWEAIEPLINRRGPQHVREFSCSILFYFFYKFIFPGRQIVPWPRLSPLQRSVAPGRSYPAPAVHDRRQQ